MAIQLKTFTPDGMATRKVSEREDHASRSSLCRLTNMWWPHTRKPSSAMADASSTRWPCSRRSRGGVNVAMSSLMIAHAREDHDVDGRVRVEPEEVLEEHRVAAERGVEDADAEDALDR